MQMRQFTRSPAENQMQGKKREPRDRPGLSLIIRSGASGARQLVLL
jgi:hypothetical protein